MDNLLAILSTMNNVYSPQLVSAEYGEQLTLILHLKGRIWDDAGNDERWNITAQGVVQHRLEFGDVEPSLEPGYPRLTVLQAAESWLTFAAAPASQRTLLADLYAVHDAARWGEFGRYGLGGDLSFGCGIFAQGPQALMDDYQTVLEAHQMRPHQLNHIPASHADLTCLHLSGSPWKDDSFIIAHTFSAHRLP